MLLGWTEDLVETMVMAEVSGPEGEQIKSASPYTLCPVSDQFLEFSSIPHRELQGAAC